MADGSTQSWPERGGAGVADADIVAGMARREPWAARLLYERVRETIDRALFRLHKGRGAHHDDLFQAAFEHIVRVLTERPPLDLLSLPAWSNVLATRVALDWIRARAREERLLRRFSGEQGLIHTNIERRLEARSDLRGVRRAIAGMSPKYAETVVLHDIVGHDLAEIAGLMDVSISAAQSRLVRGRRELLRRLQGRQAQRHGDAPHSPCP